MAEQELDYEADLEIDEYNLDKEWLRQSSLYMRYAGLCADAEKEMNDIHEDLKVTRSDLITECIADGGTKKPTGPEIEAYYRTATSHKKLKDDLTAAQHKHRILESSVRAFQMKKVALENLVRISLSSFYGEPKSPEEHPTHDQDVKSVAAKSRVKGRMTRGGKSGGRAK